MKKLSFVILICLCLGVRAQVDSLTQDGIVRVLAIGNSFSQDAVEQYLWELANEVGVKMVIGNAYRGGQGFQSHWIDETEANNTFEYRKVVNGRRTNKPRTALSEIITDEPWQYITFQQVSQESGLTTTFEPYLTYLIQYAQGLQTNPNAAYGYHQTWAYSHDSTHGGFANYGNRQEVMYDSICAAVQYALQTHPEFSFVVPSGTAIQNARTTWLGDNMNRDGYHLDLKMGRYTAACAWFETITGISPVGLSYHPDGMDFLAAHTCQVAAHEAVARPFECTILDHEGLPAVNNIVPTGLVKLNFGADHTGDPVWNDITPALRTHLSIHDSNMNPTGILVTFTGEFGGNGPRQNSVIRFSHLNPELEYEMTIFSSRDKCQDFRQTSFIVQGSDTWADALQSANNSHETAVIKHIRSTADGQLTLTVMPGSYNNSPNLFYYLNAITIKAKH